MKVVFIEEVPGTAVPGEVKDVRDGFARNYLLPRNLAVPATKASLQRAEALSKREDKRQAHLDAEAQKIVDKLEGKQILIRARVGEQGRLYGSVTASDIAGYLDELIGEPIDRRRIMLNMPLREVGTRQVALRLTRNIATNVEVVIEADETSSRGRRSTAPAGGSIIMAPRRGRAAQEELEAEGAEGAVEGESDDDDLMEEARIEAGEEETEAAAEDEATGEDETDEE
ncbi:MAG: 50S ribosomal protein L9 [Dehalococcoidia bacterium]